MYFFEVLTLVKCQSIELITYLILIYNYSGTESKMVHCYMLEVCANGLYHTLFRLMFRGLRECIKSIYPSPVYECRHKLSPEQHKSDFH